jgi:hypothetical protein
VCRELLRQTCEISLKGIGEVDWHRQIPTASAGGPTP